MGNKTKTHSKTVAGLLMLGRTTIVGLFIFSMAAAIHPDLRQFVRQGLNSQFRTVLSTVEGNFVASGKYKVLKIQTQDGLFLEVYDESNDIVKPLVDRIHISDKKDAFLLFRGEATNLAVDDIDGDAIPEIIAPSFDNNLVAHMNIYRLNPKTKKFEKVTSGQGL